MLIVAGPVGFGFGLFSALALGYVDSVHGAVLTGLIPAATAGVAVWRAGERPRRAGAARDRVPQPDPAVSGRQADTVTA